MYLTKLKSGLYAPSYPADHDESSKVNPGEEVSAKRARNVEFHRKSFALLKLGFDNQDTYDDFSIYRQVVTIKAGFVKWAKGKDGVNYPFAESLSFESMSAEKFEQWYNAVLTIIAKQTSTEKKDIENELLSFM